jgi:UrcA family protein
MSFICRAMLLAVVALATSAHANPPKPSVTVRFTPSVTVRFADLNLSSPEGNRVLYARLRKAAQTVCGTRYSVWDHGRVRAWNECFRATVDYAVAQINTPMLISLHKQLAKAPPS